MEKFIELGKLFVKRFSAEEVVRIADLSNRCRSNASITDCSVWFFAKNSSGLLLTGDNKLRKLYEKGSVNVAGILFVFDELIR